MSEHTMWWPLDIHESGWLRERSSDLVIALGHIRAGGYAYPPGDRRRYTEEGWEQWKKIAIREGIPIKVD